MRSEDLEGAKSQKHTGVQDEFSAKIITSVSLGLVADVMCGGEKTFEVWEKSQVVLDTQFPNHPLPACKSPG